MDKNQKNQQSMKSSEKPLEFTNLVGEAEEKQQKMEQSQIELQKDLENVPPSGEKPKTKKKLSEAEKIKRHRQIDADYRAKKKKENEKILAEPELKPFELIDREVVKVVAGVIPFAVIAMLLQDDRYLLNDREKDILAVQWDNLLRKRMPDIFNQFGPECSLGISIAMILIEKAGVFKPGLVKREVDGPAGAKIKGYEQK